MSVSNPNLKFEYLYLDGANWKTWGEIVIDNRNSLSVEEATQKIRSLLIDGEFFNPDHCGIKRFQNLSFDPSIDHEWYEFHQLIETEEKSNSAISFDQLLKNFSSNLPQRLQDSKYPKEPL
ncbi:hypothetical protein [Jiulongibacter sp. NS-SX5]|uniref:hypothetical protein n=1 Tax=Jiulongibacter sp. NS-SX5 TaxID=3463854 RepID=UPI004059DCFC